MWILVATAVAFGVLVALAPNVLAASAVLILVVWAGFRLKLWRFAVATSFLASIVRSGTIGSALPQPLWYAIQFGPIAIAALYLMGRPSLPMRKFERPIVVCLALYAAVALLSSLTSFFPAQSLLQAALMSLMFLFLALTMSRRWTNQDTIRGDITLVFALVCGVQAVGLAGAIAGQAWATADYGRFQGAFTNANYAGILSATGIAIGLHLFGTSKNRLWAPAAAGLLLLVGTLVLSGSRGALLALAVGVMSLFVVRASRRVLLPVGVATAALCSIVLIAAPTTLSTAAEFFSRTLQGSDVTSGRLQIYAALLARWSRLPWFGTGFRTTELLSMTVSTPGHNIYLSVLTETGIAGAIVFLALILLVLRAGPRQGPRRLLLSAAMVVLTVELTESSLLGWGGPTAMLGWLVLLAFAASGRASTGPEPRPGAWSDDGAADARPVASADWRRVDAGEFAKPLGMR